METVEVRFFEQMPAYTRGIETVWERIDTRMLDHSMIPRINDTVTVKDRTYLVANIHWNFSDKNVEIVIRPFKWAASPS